MDLRKIASCIQVSHHVDQRHAIQAGLDMAIVNAGQLEIYDQIDPRLRDAVEDVVLNRHPGATENLLDIAQEFQGSNKREASSEDVATLRRENEQLKQLVAELSLKNRVLKKSLSGLE